MQYSTTIRSGCVAPRADNYLSIFTLSSIGISLWTIPRPAVIHCRSPGPSSPGTTRVIMVNRVPVHHKSGRCEWNYLVTTEVLVRKASLACWQQVRHSLEPTVGVVGKAAAALALELVLPDEQKASDINQSVCTMPWYILDEAQITLRTSMRKGSKLRRNL